MNNLEKECRYRATEDNFKKIRKVCSVVEPKQKQVDLTLGYAGFNSLNKYGYVCRVRQKGIKTWMEVKNKTEQDTFKETAVQLNDFKSGVRLFQAIGMKPYMYMRREREILEYKRLKIFLDDIELLGKFIEIEYQEVNNPEDLLKEFITLVNIEPILQPLYGDILNQLLIEDESFRKRYELKLTEFLKEK
ncbi:MAG: CYTH domain-containing protein [Clostridia bacterium]|nr:CYTH domain-containing protein [Clostridia bacterium]